MKSIQNPGPRMLLAALISAEIVTSIEISMLYIAMPKVVAQYGNPSLAFWVITAYFIVATASVTLSSSIGDLIGRKNVLIGILSISLCGSLISALTTNYIGLIVGRSLTGFVSAALPLCFGLVRQHFPPAKVSMGIGLAAAIPSIAGVTSMLVGGVLIDHYPWRMIFFVSSTLAFFAIMMVLVIVPRDDAKASKSKIDWLGGILMIPAILTFLAVINLGKAQGWSSPWPYLLLLVSFALWAVWAVHELRHSRPLVDLHMLMQRKVLMTNLAMLLLALGVINTPGAISIMLQQPSWTGAGFGVSAGMAGLLHMPLAISALVGGWWSGHIAGKSGARQAGLIGAFISLASWIAMLLYHDDLYVFMSLFYLAIFGFTIVYSAIPNLIVENAPQARTSGQTGITTFVRLLGSAIGSQIVAALLGLYTIPNPAKPEQHLVGPDSIMLALWLFTGSAALALVLIWAIAPSKRWRRKTVPPLPNPLLTPNG